MWLRMMDLQNKMVSFSGVNMRLAKQENTTWTWISRCVYLRCQISILPLLCPRSKHTHPPACFFLPPPQKHKLIIHTKITCVWLAKKMIWRSITHIAHPDLESAVVSTFPWCKNSNAMFTCLMQCVHSSKFWSLETIKVHFDIYCAYTVHY